MYRAIVYVGLFSAVILSTEALACGAKENVVVKNGCKDAAAAATDTQKQPVCDSSKFAEMEYETAHNTCDGDKPASKGKDKDDGDGKACLSAPGSSVSVRPQITETTRETVFSFLKTFSAVCEPGYLRPSNSSAGG